MCACVEDDYRMFRGIAQIFHESREIEALLLRVPVAVLVQPGESRIPELWKRVKTKNAYWYRYPVPS